jgi:predicted esterase
MTIDGKVIHGKSALHYVKAGKGQHTLLFFHGFGQDHSVYLPLVQTLAPHCTLFIFDLRRRTPGKTAMEGDNDFIPG